MKHRRIVHLLLSAAGLVYGTIWQRGFAADLVEPAKLESIARPLVDDGWVAALSIGLVNERGTQFAGFGQVSPSNTAAPAPDTVFEIGSISKVFTGLLLAQMVEDKTVSLNEPVQELLGDSIAVPKLDKTEITLVDLATHTSGLPRMPTNFAPKDPENPYADYTVEQMAKFLSGYKLRRDPGERSEYSNLGMGLLGHALALKSGTSYEALMRKRIAEPLGMRDTVITLGEPQKARLAAGHDFDGNPSANWDLPTLAGAGAIRSTAADMLKFLSVNIGLVPTPFDAALANCRAVHFKQTIGEFDVGLAWQIRRADQLVWHNGQTGGYHSFAAFSRDKKVGVVVLANSTTLYADALGFRLVDLLATGSAEPLKLKRPVTVAADALEKLVGKYTINPLLKADVTRKDDALFIQVTSQPKIRLFPLSPTEFFCRAVEAQFSFDAVEDGKIKQLVIHQNGMDVTAARAE